MNAIRTTSIYCVAQVVIIVGGILCIADAHKVIRTLFNDSPWYLENTQFSVLLRDHGWLMLFIPILCILFSAAMNPANEKMERISLIGNRTITFGVLCVFIYGLLAVFRTPLIIAIPQ